MSERYINLSDRQVKDTQNQSQNFMSINTICRRLNQQDQRIAELEEQLKNATHKFNIYQEVYYLDYKYKFEPYISKYLTVCKGKVLDIILREEGYVDYNFTFDDLKWITEENVFATKEDALAKLEELGENK